MHPSSVATPADDPPRKHPASPGQVPAYRRVRLHLFLSFRRSSPRRRAAAAAAQTKAKAVAAAEARARAEAAAEAKAKEVYVPKLSSSTYYQNCTAVRAAGADPIHAGQPGYSRKLDRDGDGVACE